MKALDLNAMEKIGGGSWSCFGGVIGLIGLGIVLTTTTAEVGSLA